MQRGINIKEKKLDINEWKKRHWANNNINPFPFQDAGLLHQPQRAHYPPQGARQRGRQDAQVAHPGRDRLLALPTNATRLPARVRARPPAAVGPQVQARSKIKITNSQ